MPTVAHGSKVLVTGANGYIAAWIVRNLLEKGYNVRGTVRTQEKGNRLKEIYEKFGYGDRFEFCIVSDIVKDGAFDEAVKGVDAIEHTASPVTFSTELEPQELIRPAVLGTVSILKSALYHGRDVQRIVFTSSCGAVLSVHPEPRIFNESNWNDQAVEMSERDGKNAAPITKYRASKVLAERAAWKFLEENKASINWDLVVINPPFVFGPVIHDVSTVSALNLSTGQFYSFVVAPGEKAPQVLRTNGNSWVDVRDVAEAHVAALQKEEAANERLIVSAGSVVWQDWLDIAYSIAPTHLPSHTNLPRGVPLSDSTGGDVMYQINYDTSKADRILGIKYRTKEETLKDTFADYEARGW